jgi:hypothetical protein
MAEITPINWILMFCFDLHFAMEQIKTKELFNFSWGKWFKFWVESTFPPAFTRIALLLEKVHQSAIV